MLKLDPLIPTLKQAFNLIKTNLQPMLAAVVLVMSILFAISLVGFQFLVEFADVDPSSPESIAEGMLPLQLVILIIAAPFEAGLVWLGWRCVTGQPVSVKDVFQPWALATQLILIALISSVLANIGMYLFLPVGLYLMAVLSFANLYYLLRRGSPMQALVESAKQSHQSILLIVVYHLVMAVLVAVSLIPFGLGLLVSVPMYFYGKAILFKHIFTQFEPTETVAEDNADSQQNHSGSFEA